MIAAGLFIFACIVLVLVTAKFGPRLGASPETHVSGVESLLAISAIIAAAIWYLISRPDDPKLKFDQTVSAVPLPNGQALLLGELSMSNVGGRVLKLHDVRIQQYVQQVTPLVDANPALEASPLHNPDVIQNADKWRYLASRDFKITSEIESGEVENLYARSVVKCSDHLQVYFSTWVDKPNGPIARLFNRPPIQWIKQSLVDVTPACQSTLGEKHEMAQHTHRSHRYRRGTRRGLSRASR